jgi:hypothetical protein
MLILMKGRMHLFGFVRVAASLSGSLAANDGEAILGM